MPAFFSSSWSSIRFCKQFHKALSYGGGEPANRVNRVAECLHSSFASPSRTTCCFNILLSSQFHHRFACADYINYDRAHSVESSMFCFATIIIRTQKGAPSFSPHSLFHTSAARALQQAVYGKGSICLDLPVYEAGQRPSDPEDFSLFPTV